LLTVNLDGVIEPEDSDDEIDQKFRKFMPSSEKIKKQRDLKQIPSYEEVSEELQKIKIKEYLNPKIPDISESQGNDFI
jgi:hypothetical protein